MPVTRSRNGLYDMNLDQTNTTRFLFGDDEPNSLPRGRTPDDNFPTLVRREDQMVSEGNCGFKILRVRERLAVGGCATGFGAVRQGSAGILM